MLWSGGRQGVGRGVETLDMAGVLEPTLEVLRQWAIPVPKGADMAHDNTEPEENTEPAQEGEPKPPPEQGTQPGSEPEQPESPSGQWEDPPRPPSPSGFNPDYWPKY